MLKNYSWLLLSIFAGLLSCSQAFAAQEVKGQPESKWSSPIGEDLENTSDNRCHIIKVLKPGESNVAEAQRNANQLLTRYASELYFQSAKTLFELDEEKPDKAKTVTNEKDIMDEEILARMANIADRLNIIVSLESRAAILDSVNQIIKLNSSVYSGYKFDEETKKCSMDNGR